MMTRLLPWILFNLFVLAMLAVDLGIFHRKAHVVKTREALTWTAVWVILALLFDLGLLMVRGPTPAMEFLAGYLIEKSLSVDNIFVFLVLFTYFQVAPQLQHTVLFWGIVGALIMRALLILVGAALIQTVHWILYVFGGFLILTGLRLMVQEEADIHPERNVAVKFFRRFFPVTTDYRDAKFFVREGGRMLATPLFLVLLVVETTDLIFALDSIPAIFAVSRDPFIVYTSNVFAILGLRALYFALAGMIGKFHYLRLGLAFVLLFVGIKMLIAGWYHIPIAAALGVVAAILLVSILASLLKPPPHPPAAPPPGIRHG